MKDNLTPLEKLLLCKLLFPDRTNELIQKFVTITLQDIQSEPCKYMGNIANKQKELGLPMLLL